MAKLVLFEAALLLLFIAGGRSQPTTTPSTTPILLPPLCTAAIANCQADTACSALYAAFEKSCKEERDSMPANCTQECLNAIYALIGHPLGVDTMLCDCNNPSLPDFLINACRTSQTNLQANCFPPPPPGMPMCGRPCAETQGRCFQDLTCASLVLSIPSKCSDIVAWNGEGDLPACCGDCRDTLNMINKLPNALELECCNCSGDLACEMLQTKLSAACPSRTNCKTDCPKTTPMCPQEPPAPLCGNLLVECPMCNELVNEQALACKSVLDWDGQGNPPVCPTECMNATYAIGALPNVKELACCDCGEGAPGMECNMRKTKIGAACGNDIDCNTITTECPSEPGPTSNQTCTSFYLNCPECRELIDKQNAACSSVYAWDGQGNPPTCPEACLAASKGFEALPNAAELSCCDCGEGQAGAECEAIKMKLAAACGITTECPSEPGPSSDQTCTSFYLNCPECRELIDKQNAACSSVYAWDGQGNPPTCPEACLAASKGFEALPNAAELSCCDCGEGQAGAECEAIKMKLAAACGITTECPSEPGPSSDQTCTSFYLNCPECRELIDKQATACSSVYAWDGQGNPPTCPKACQTANLAFQSLPNAKEVSCCECGEDALGAECEMRKTKIVAACGHTTECNDTKVTPEGCPLDLDSDDTRPFTCHDIVAKCPMHSQLVTKQLSDCSSVLEWDGEGKPPMCPDDCLNAIKAVEALPNAAELACCDCGEGALGAQCNTSRMKLTASCGSIFTCDEMCPTTQPLDCYTNIGRCARDCLCASLTLDVNACIDGESYMNTSKCQDARFRLFDYTQRFGVLSAECICITSPVLCTKYQIAVSAIGEEVPECSSKAATDECKADATCNAIFEEWKNACDSLKKKSTKTCGPRCAIAGDLLRQNILGSRVWQCPQGSGNKSIKSKYLKLCLE